MIKKKNIFFSLIIPFYNEENNLKILIPELLKSLKTIKYEYEVIFIDDGSIDLSKTIVKKLISKKKNFKLIVHKKNIGQTQCYISALKICKGKFFLRMDSDLQDQPQDIKKFISAFKKEFDLVIGFRKNRKHKFLLLMLSSLFDLFIRVISRKKLKSYTGSFVGYKTKFLKRRKFKKNDHRYFPLIYIFSDLKVCDVILKHKPRSYGKSYYSITNKILFAIPELFSFIARYKLNGLK